LLSDRKKALMAFQKAAGIKFKNPELLNLAFVHRSVSNEAGGVSGVGLPSAEFLPGPRLNNERLEFLGDSILGAITATLLYSDFSDKNEGDLAKIKAVVVSEEALSGIARELQIDSLLLLGKGEDRSGGRGKKAILADAFEALIGALYLDSGYRAASIFVSPHIRAEIRRVLEKNYYRDYKSLLQELCQHEFHSYPEYRMVKRSGPEHERFFWMEVTVQGKVFGPGMGRNKKSAEQEAARMAFEALGNESPA
jgi:ribonuclease-3